MHDTALAHAEAFFGLYGTRARTVIDFGSRNVNGSMRSVCPHHLAYTGVDMESGAGVDVVVAPGEPLPFPSESYDLVLSSSCLEHDPCFWETFVDLMRLLAPGGYAYLNVPSNGRYHRHPFDCWRFYPDAGLALASWARRRELDVTLVESFIASRRDAEWNDAILIFTKGPVVLPRQLLADISPRATNIRRFASDEVGACRYPTEDQILLQHFAGRCGHTIDYEAVIAGGDAPLVRPTSE